MSKMRSQRVAATPTNINANSETRVVGHCGKIRLIFLNNNYNVFMIITQKQNAHVPKSIEKTKNLIFVQIRIIVLNNMKLFPF